MKTRSLKYVWSVICIGWFLPLGAFADVQTIRATGEYRVILDDTMEEAHQLAFAAAKASAMEQIITNLEALPDVRRLGLNRDELRAYGMGIGEISENPSGAMSAEAQQTVVVSVIVTIDSALVAHQFKRLMKNRPAKRELFRIRDTIDVYRKELDVVQQRLTAGMPEAESAAVRQQREGILNLIEVEEQLARTWIALLSAQESRFTEER